MRSITLVPAGSSLRIDRLMKDNGEWGGLRVLGTLDDGTGHPQTVELDPTLLADKYFQNGIDIPKIWAVAPDMLEK